MNTKLYARCTFCPRERTHVYMCGTCWRAFKRWFEEGRSYVEVAVWGAERKARFMRKEQHQR